MTIPSREISTKTGWVRCNGNRENKEGDNVKKKKKKYHEI